MELSASSSSVTSVSSIFVTKLNFPKVKGTKKLTTSFFFPFLRKERMKWTDAKVGKQEQAGTAGIMELSVQKRNFPQK